MLGGQNATVVNENVKVSLEGCHAVKAAKARKLTRKQRLALALKACRNRHTHSEAARAGCEKRARQTYAAGKTTRRKTAKGDQPQQAARRSAMATGLDTRVGPIRCRRSSESSNAALQRRCSGMPRYGPPLRLCRGHRKPERVAPDPPGATPRTSNRSEKAWTMGTRPRAASGCGRGCSPDAPKQPLLCRRLSNRLDHTVDAPNPSEACPTRRSSRLPHRASCWHRCHSQALNSRADQTHLTELYLNVIPAAYR